MSGYCGQVPFQSRESRVIAIKCDPLAAPLDGEGGVPGVGDTGSADVGLNAESLEDIPVPLTRLHDLAMWLFPKTLAESEHLLESARCAVGARIRGDANHRAQRQRRNAEAGIAVDDAGEPRMTECVLRHVLPKRIDEDIHVRQDHLKCFIRSTYSRSSNSSSAENLVISIPGIGPPVALLTGSGPPFFFKPFLGSATTIRSPSSIRDVRVRPSAAALRLARVSRSWGRRTVVRSLICQNIWLW